MSRQNGRNREAPHPWVRSMNGQADEEDDDNDRTPEGRLSTSSTGIDSATRRASQHDQDEEWLE